MSETAVASRQVGGRTVPAAGTWVIDPNHSSFEFVARYLGFKVRGRFPGSSGTAQIAEVPEESSVQVELDTATVDTRNEQRDGHLRSPDFFDVENHPKITFRSTAVRPADEETRWQLDGELTILDTTRPVTFDLEFVGTSTDPWGSQRAGFSASTEVNREDWGLVWNAPLETGGFLLGKTARLEIEAQVIRQ